ncbi:hypothetical protein HMPREF0083_04514 [Aneurinibacillus aneurinilyticus ATCC 12856]|uniref:Uncharacterized protein n=1 Tax=Aneurinibacillus aneurinilyticus ATCC 12856 TaxID=649747 RepID=U1WYR2_ANEAE|nr:hypothetical protein HMPREF0083_04514 [Aneurinibacillus aneurinilyticus ATCC 12856]
MLDKPGYEFFDRDLHCFLLHLFCRYSEIPPPFYRNPQFDLTQL